MKLTALCCTYNRPNVIHHAIQSFLRQDYPENLRELIVLDDYGSYAPQEHENWCVVVSRRRFLTLGEKMNAVAGLASRDSDGYVVWEDDDIYLPWTFRAHAESLQRGDWSVPSEVILEHSGPRFSLHKTNGMFHSAWAYRRDAFAKVSGYPFALTTGDMGLMDRFRRANVKIIDPLAFGFRPYLIYRWFTTGYKNASAFGDRGYLLAECKPKPSALTQIDPKWPRDYVAITKSLLEPAENPQCLNHSG